MSESYKIITPERSLLSVLRGVHGMSQSEFGRVVGLSRNSIGSAEREGFEPVPAQAAMLKFGLPDDEETLHLLTSAEPRRWIVTIQPADDGQE